MVDSDFDYTLMIEFERLSIEELKYTLQILYHSSSSCYIDIEHLADEVIKRLIACRYRIREKENKSLDQVIKSTFETLKSIAPFMTKPSDRIHIIYENYRKYMYGIESPVVSPVVSPSVSAPKIMKKASRRDKGKGK